jgi:hypothetical protein
MWDEWHKIMVCLNMTSIKQLKSKGMVTGVEVDESVPAMEQCLACILTKQHLTPYPQESKTEIVEIGDLTVSDIWGLAQTTGIRGEKYFVMFTDGKSHQSMCYFLKNKSEALSKFKQYKVFVETQTGCKFKKLRVDGGGEYIGDEFRKYLLDNGIFLEVMAVYSSSQNGIAECRN